jgi:hypothetical protein
MSKNVLFLVAIEVPGWEHRSAPYKYGISSYENWCKKNNVELFIQRELIHPHEKMKVNFTRYYAFELLEKAGIDWDQVLFTDVDSIIHPDCPNPFNEVNEDELGLVHANGCYEWACRSMENYAHIFEEFNVFDVFKYFSSGFLLFSKHHKDLFEEVLSFYWKHEDKIKDIQKKLMNGTDQPIINHLVQKNNVKSKYLSYNYCFVDIHRKMGLREDMPFTKIPGMYQYNAIPNNEDTSQTSHWMKKTYEHLYGELK